MGSTDRISLHCIIGDMLPLNDNLHDICSKSGSMLQLFAPSNPSGLMFVWQIGVDAAHNQNNCHFALSCIKFSSSENDKHV